MCESPVGLGLGLGLGLECSLDATHIIVHVGEPGLVRLAHGARELLRVRVMLGLGGRARVGGWG